MSAVSLVFAPSLPWWLLAALAASAVALVGLSFWRRARGALWRAVFLALALLFLANPILRREQRQPLDDLVLMVSDRSPSQGLNDRPAQLDAAERGLRERLGRMPGVELREVRLDGEGREGTRLFTRLQEVLAESDRARLGAVIALTDGQVHDAPADPAKFTPGAPLQVLLTGHSDESDRQLVVLQAPGFGVVGEPQVLEMRVDDAADPAADVPITLRQDGQVVRQFTVRPGAPTQVPFTLGKAGSTVIEVEAATRPGELTNLNNRVTVQVSGVRDRLRVLLVTGEPHPGERTWRALRAKLSLWRSRNRATFEHRHLMVEAEVARLEGEPLQALKRLEEAIAASGEFVHERALAEELAGDLCQQEGLAPLAGRYYAAAQKDYAAWGAAAKAAM